jgi:hypothetical protein
MREIAANPNHPSTGGLLTAAPTSPPRNPRTVVKRAAPSRLARADLLGAKPNRHAPGSLAADT